MPLAEIKARLSEMVDRVEQQHDRIVLTRHGRPAVVLVSPAELDALEDPLDLLPDPVAMSGRGGMSTAPWQLVVAASAERSVARLPATVAPAVVEFLTGPLPGNPVRAGHAPHRELAGLRAARRGSYRTVYELDVPDRVVRVIRIDHRADVYRSR